jgi:hypothetical protein
MQHWIKHKYRGARVDMHFDSVVELADMIRRPESRPDWFTGISAAQWTDVVGGHLERSSAAGWFSVLANNPIALLNFVLGGWPAGVEQLRGALGDLEVASMFTRHRRKRRRGDQGDELDIHRVYRGDLSNAWQRMGRAEKPGAGKPVTVVCNLGAHSGIDADQLFWRGATAIHLAEVLMQRGHPVQIVAALGGREIAKGTKRKLADLPSSYSMIRGPIDHETSITLKGFNDPVDFDRIASMVCTGAGYRGVGWIAKVMSTSICGRYIDDNWGYPKPLASPPCLSNYPGAAIMVPGSILSLDDARAFVHEKLETETVT